MDIKKEKAKVNKVAKRITAMLPQKSDTKLSRMVIMVRSNGIRAYKQDVNAAIIDYVYANREILKKLKFKLS